MHLPAVETPIDPLERKVRELVGLEMGLDVDEVLLDAALAEDLGCDELDVAEIAIALEEAFKLEEIDADVAEGFVRVKDVVEYVRRRA
jgi:acyl carrier protein